MFTIIIVNIVINIKIKPGLLPVSILNSLYNLIIILLIIIWNRFFNIQNGNGIIINIKKTLNQFIDMFVLVAGSNVENKLVIIFNLFYLF